MSKSATKIEIAQMQVLKILWDKYEDEYWVNANKIEINNRTKIDFSTQDYLQGVVEAHANTIECLNGLWSEFWDLEPLCRDR